MLHKRLTFEMRQQRYQFVFKSGFSLLCLFFFVLLCSLGTWQIHRYHYKKDLLSLYQANLNAEPQLFSAISQQDNLKFMRVKATGYYQNKNSMLLQNQFHDGNVGYDVLTPFKIAGEKKLLLIDRGWVARPRNETLPMLEDVHGQQQVDGYLKTLDERSFTLGKNILEPTHSPIVMQKIDINELEKITHQEYFPYILRLDPQAPFGFIRAWNMSTVVPERHMGYAVQWFLMALVLVIAYFCFSIEREKP